MNLEKKNSENLLLHCLIVNLKLRVVLYITVQKKWWDATQLICSKFKKRCFLWGDCWWGRKKWSTIIKNVDRYRGNSLLFLSIINSFFQPQIVKYVYCCIFSAEFKRLYFGYGSWRVERLSHHQQPSKICVLCNQASTISTKNWILGQQTCANCWRSGGIFRAIKGKRWLNYSFF